MDLGSLSRSPAFEIWLKSAGAEVDSGCTWQPVRSCRAELASRACLRSGCQAPGSPPPCSPSTPCGPFPKRSFSTNFAQCQGPSLTGGDTEGGEDGRQVGSRVRLQPGGSSRRRFPSGAWRGSLPPPDGRRGLTAVPVQPSCRAPDLHGPREGSQPACCLGRPQLRDFSEAQHLRLFDGLVQSRA